MLTNSHYISDANSVRLGGEDTMLMPREDEVVVFQSFSESWASVSAAQDGGGSIKMFNIYICTILLVVQ